MCSVTVSDPIARCTLPRSGPLVPDPVTDEGAALLVAALEEIESRRAALEWLLANDLVRQCLV
jgi:hypothetical protein